MQIKSHVNATHANVAHSVYFCYLKASGGICMTWMSASQWKKFALVSFTFVSVSCAPVEKDSNVDGIVPAKPPQLSPPTSTITACTPAAAPALPTLIKLSDQQKEQALDALTGYMRMNNSLGQVYKPEEKSDLDAVEQYIVKTLQDYCAVAKNSQKNGNATDESFSLVGDACPAKNIRRTRDTFETGAGFIRSAKSADEDYTLLTPELTQFLPQTALKGLKCNSTNISMPHRSMIQQVLGQSDNVVLQSKYGQILASQHVDLTLLNVAIENGDYIEIGELLKVDGYGTRIALKFAAFEAVIEVKYRRENGKLVSSAFINGDPLSDSLFVAADLWEPTKLLKSSLAK
jgi:hypothetical protein